MSWLNEQTEARMNELFEKYVPAMGATETKVGEVVRALSRVAYRWFNDGDYFHEGYGAETCGKAATFLIQNTTLEIAKLFSDEFYDDSYKEWLEILCVQVLDYLDDYLDENPEGGVCPYDMFKGENFFEDRINQDSEIDDYEEEEYDYDDEE
jgi:hypothetical protein